MNGKDESRDAMKDIAAYIKHRTGGKYGFCVLVYENGNANGRLNYVSNSDRAGVVDAMREFIEKTEGKGNYGTHKLEPKRN